MWKKVERSVLDCSGLGILNRKQGRYLSWIGKDGQNLESKDRGGRLIQAWTQSIKKIRTAGGKGYPKGVEGHKQKQGGK